MKDVLSFGRPGGPWVTETTAWAEEFRLPLDALKVIVEDPSGAEEEAARVTVCPAVVMEKGEAGEDVRPLGRPLKETLIVWLKPFKALTERFRVVLCPTPTDWLCGLTLIKKLGDGPGLGGEDAEPPPQAARETKKSISTDVKTHQQKIFDLLSGQYIAVDQTIRVQTQFEYGD